MPLLINYSDTIVQPLYDRLSFAAGASLPTEINLFNQPNTASGRSTLDTNLRLVSQLEPPKWFNATHLELGWNTDAIKADIDAFLKNFALQFNVGDKSYLDVLAIDCPANFGLGGYSTATAQQAWTNGPSGSMFTFDLRLPAGMEMKDQNNTPYINNGLTGIIIPQSQNFNVRLYNPGGNTVTLSVSGNGFQPRVVLRGILNRSVQ